MSFRANDSQQIAFFDSLTGLTEREQKFLEKSWAKPFAEDIFPAIDEERFSVLYSSKASRPNTPVNVIIGALIIKELFDLSDDEVLENLMLDPRYQYALHTTSLPEQPMSDKTLSRFRQRCYEYERETNIDLYGDCVKDLSAKIAKLMHISGQVRRMDSMMVDSNIRKLSRTELIYRCISKLLHYMDDRKAPIPDEMKHYLDDNDYNQLFYHRRSSNTEDTLAQLLADSSALLALCGSDYEGITEYDLFVRCITEQTITEEDGKRRLRTKEDGGMNSKMLQSPADPDATFREKARKKHSGYVLNVEESVGSEGSVITDYQFEQNIYSDSQFLKEHVDRMEVQEKPVTLVADGAYSGSENAEEASKKNVTLVTTDLTGKPTRDILADFTFSKNGKEILTCPAGHVPTKSSYQESTGQCYASFPRALCENCPHRDQCKARLFQKKATVMVSKTSHDRAKSQRFQKTETFKNLARLRNGVETIPSILRRLYNIDRMPRGLQRGRFFVGSKIAALNFRKLFAAQQKRGNYAQNPMIA